MSESGTRMEDFNINELMLFIVGVLGAFGGLCVIIQKSKCSKISICGMGCERDVGAVIQEEKLQITGHTGSTPKEKLKLELKEEKPLKKNGTN
tara:strand:- start:82 stop:360 length:279 start_codon:yes stop_codon:yes gene_type:complete